MTDQVRKRLHGSGLAKSSAGFVAVLIMSVCGCNQSKSPESPSAKNSTTTTAVPSAANDDSPHAETTRVEVRQPAVESPAAIESTAGSESVEGVGSTVTITVPDVSEAAKPDNPPKPVQVDLSLPLHEPLTKFSEAHAKSNLVKSGDAFPVMTLPDLEGKGHEISSLYGDRLTVVVFWSANLIFADEEYARLNREVVDPFRPAGVRVIAVNVKDSANLVRTRAEETESRAANLLDETGDAFSMIATAHLPRTYLLDSKGKILWFDIEYSRTTRRDLRNAIVFYLDKAGLLAKGGG